MDLYINNLSDELAYGVSGSDWIIVDPTADYFIFSSGSATVADGESIPSETELNRAAVQLDADNPVNVSKYFLADDTDSKLKEIIGSISLPAIYQHLKELESKSLINRKKEGKIVYYSITKKGRKVLDALDILITLL